MYQQLTGDQQARVVERVMSSLFVPRPLVARAMAAS